MIVASSMPSIEASEARSVITRLGRSTPLATGIDRQPPS
jgi:hypothetical protein